MIVFAALGLLVGIVLWELKDCSDEQIHELVHDIILPALGWIAIGFGAIAIVGMLVLFSFMPSVLTIIYFFFIR
jgi:hypothetical protein